MLLAMLVLGLLVLTGIFLFRASGDKLLTEQGDKIVSMIEEYKEAHGKLPNNLEVLGLEKTNEYWDEYSNFYFSHKEGSLGQYRLSATVGVGRALVYDSEAARWHYEN